jgi:2,4-dienoyl-CoA reductase-like NADH-dependent reductase (Old Yellow Enzyme family)
MNGDILEKDLAEETEANGLVDVNSPIQLKRGAPIKNRILKSAMSEALGTTDNRVTMAYPSLYRAWAKGGTGLVITGNVMIDRRALGEPNNVALEDDKDMSLLKSWAEAATENDTHCWVQLNHPGKQSPKGLNKETVSPSAIPKKRFHLQPFLLKKQCANFLIRLALSSPKRSRKLSSVLEIAQPL